MISPRRILVDGTVLGAVFSVVVLVSVRVDPTIWLEDYPPDIRAAVGDSVQPPVALQGLFGVILMVVMIGGLLWSVRRLDHDLGGVGFGAAWLHVFLIFWIVNAADVVVVDWLFFIILFRDWVVLPGTEGMAGYGDYLFHLRGSFLTPTPWIGSLVLSLGLSSGWWWFVARRRGIRPTAR